MVGRNESDSSIFVVGSLGTQFGLWGEGGGGRGWSVDLWFL